MIIKSTYYLSLFLATDRPKMNSKDMLKKKNIEFEPTSK